MNYGQLKTLVAQTSHRSDITSLIPGFIEQAEQHISNRIRATDSTRLYKLGEANRDVPGSPEYLFTDNFFLEVIYIFRSDTSDFSGAHIVDRYQPKDFLTTLPQGVVLLNPNSYVVGGSGRSIGFSPTPELNAIMNVLSYVRPTPLVNDADETALLTNNPDLYLYGALRYLAAHVQDVELIQVYDSLFDVAAQGVNDQAFKQHEYGPVQIKGESAWA